MIGTMTAGLVIKDTEQPIPGFEETFHSIRIIEVAGGRDGDLFRLQQVRLAVEEVL